MPQKPNCKVYNKGMIKKVSLLVVLLLLGLAGYYFFNKPSEESLKAPGKDWESAKKVEDYFIERLHMPPEEASVRRNKLGVDSTVELRINTNVTLQGLTGNLFHYGFIKIEKAFLYALEHTKDTTLSEKAIKVGTSGTIDQNAEYRISEDMNAWELADKLLNKPDGHFSYDEYNYFFMP